MDSTPSDTISVIDFRRRGMILQWHVSRGSWVACDVPPAQVHGVALIRASGPNICLFGRGGQLHLQVGADQYSLSRDSLRIKCRPVLASLGLRKRFTVEEGAGFVAVCGCFDHVVRNNRFILKNGGNPMVRLATPDCVGIELSDNVLVGGNGQLIESAAPLAMDRGNRALPAPPPGEPLPARPAATPPSIYQWQQETWTMCGVSGVGG